MKTPRAFMVEPAEDRARTRRRVAAGSDGPEAKLVRTRAAVVLKTEPPRLATNTEIVEVSTISNTRPTRQLQHAQNLFALLNPDADPPPPVAPAVVEVRPLSPLEQSIARREQHRTRRMLLSESDLDVPLGRTTTGGTPLVDWTPARVPSIDLESSSVRALAAPGEVAQQSYRKGLVMGVAIASTVGAALAAVLALVA